MKDLTKGNEAVQIILFAIPMLLGNVFQQFYNIADSMVVGNWIGKDALAAVGQSFPVIFISVALVMGFGMAGNILIAQAFGAKKMERVSALIGTLLAVMIVFSLVITVLGVFLTPAILTLMRTPPEVFDQAALYLRIIFAGSAAVFGYNALSAILRGLGDSKTPLYALIISTILNIGLDILFVAAFGWGIAGVGIATVISQIVSLSWTLWYLVRNNPVFTAGLSMLRPNPALFREILRIGLPSGFQQGLVGAGLMTLTGIVNGFGADTAAAFAAAGKLDAFAVMPAMNLSMAMASFTGQNIGAGKMDRVQRGLGYGLFIALGITCTIASVLFFAGDKLVMLFTREPVVVQIGFEYLRIVSLAYIAQTIMFVYGGVIRGAGEVIYPMITTLLAMWIVRIPLALHLAPRMGTDGVWWSITSGFFVGMIATAAYYYTGRWKRKHLARGSIDPRVSGQLGETPIEESMSV